MSRTSCPAREGCARVVPCAAAAPTISYRREQWSASDVTGGASRGPEPSLRGLYISGAHLANEPFCCPAKIGPGPRRTLTRAGMLFPLFWREYASAT
eukprot:scaffold1471_cov413-Prasinococcus_capsulatus_cf.AAC.20